tara:strand:+ start:1884 stop:4808 length:2925 start_codon:yes stop_codon:yes gene_type:complete
MGIVTVDTKYGPVDVTIAGDNPTTQEVFKLDDIKFNTKRYLSEDVLADYEKTKGGFDPEFDSETGVKDAALRGRLGLAENEDEEMLALQQSGLGDGDYTRDNRGRLALTPQGAGKMGIESDRSILVDESGFTRYDFADLSGLAAPVTGAIAGAIAGQALIPVPIVGAVIGAAFGGGSGNLAEEAIEAGMGTSSQTALEIAKDTGKEALVAAIGEGVVGLVAKTFGVGVRGFGGSKLSPDQATMIDRSIRQGVVPAPGQTGANPIIARADATSEQIFKGSPRTKANNKAINEKLDLFRSLSSAEADKGALVGSFRAATREADSTILKAESEASTAILKSMESVADDLGRASKTDATLSDDLYGAFRSAYQNFDAMATSKFSRIQTALDDTIGTVEFIPTKDIALRAGEMKKTFASSQDGTTGGKMYSLLNNIENLGPKTSFKTIYETRKSLNDFLRMNSGGVTIQREGRLILGKLDDRLDLLKTKGNLQKFAENAGVRGPELPNISSASAPLSDDSISIIKNAADDLLDARRFYEKGMRYFDDVGASASIKAIREDLKNGIRPDVTQTMTKLVANNKPKTLVAARTVFDEFGGKGSFDSFQTRMAGAWLKENLATSINPLRPDKFSPSAFKKKVDALGSTADQLFGKQANEVRRLANQIDAISLKNVDQKIIDRVALEGAEGNPINLLRNLKSVQEEAASINKDQLLKQLRDKDLSIEKAADILTQGSTKTASITKVMKYYKNEPEAMEQLRSVYMENIIGDFGENFLTNPKQFKEFGNRLIKEHSSGKLPAVYGKELSDDMLEFGQTLVFNSQTVDGGGLIAASVAASPLQNLGTLFRFGLISRVFSSQVYYKGLQKRVDLAMGKGVSRPAALAKVIAQSLTSAAGQLGAQATDKSISSGIRQAETFIENSQQQKPQTTSPTLNPTSIPDVSPVFEVPEVSSISGPQASIRDRVRDNPALAASLLGGLDNIGFV